MSFAKEGIEWMASVFRQAIPQLQDQGDTLRHHYYLLSDQMNTLAQGTTGWEGQASAVCQQLWEDLGPNLMLQIEALDNLCDALSILADQFDVIHANPSQAAADMGLPVAGLSLSVGGDAAGDAGSALLGGLALPIAIVAFVVVAGVVVYVTEQEEEQNAITATQQVVAFRAGRVDDATTTIPHQDAPGTVGGQGDPGPDSPKWPYYVIAAVLVAGGVGGFIAYERSKNPLNQSDEQTAQELEIEAQTQGINISLDEIRDIIRRNPGLTKEQYLLLMKLQAQYPNAQPFGVIDVVETTVNGKPRIVYLTQGTINKWKNSERATEIAEEFDLTPEEFGQIIMDELTREAPTLISTNPDKLRMTDVEINGKYYTIDVIVSTDPSKPGFIITSYERLEIDR